MNRTATKHLLHQLFLVSRPISWPNTAYPFAAGYAVVQQSIDLRLVVGSLFFLIPYNLIMYGINDVFDYESDIRNPRKGGIEGAMAAKKLHRPILIACAVLGLPSLVWLLALGTLAANLVLLVVMFFVLAYSIKGLRFKEIPFLDSITSSIHFVGPLVYGLVLAGFPAAAWGVVASFFLWGCASHAFGAVQDVVPDREGGLSSIATVLGAARTVQLAITAYIAVSVILLFYGVPTAILSLAGLLYVINCWPYRKVSDQDSASANKAWRRFIYLNLFAGFLVTMVLIYRFVLNS